LVLLRPWWVQYFMPVDKRQAALTAKNAIGTIRGAK
jgi:hypothetical protein